MTQTTPTTRLDEAVERLSLVQQGQALVVVYRGRPARGGLADDLRLILSALKVRTALMDAFEPLFADDPILCDCIDNSGRPYTSAWLAQQLSTISAAYRAALQDPRTPHDHTI